MIMVDRDPLFRTALVALGAILTTWAASVLTAVPVLTGFRQTTPDEEEPRVGETVKTQVSRTL